MVLNQNDFSRNSCASVQPYLSPIFVAISPVEISSERAGKPRITPAACRKKPGSRPWIATAMRIRSARWASKICGPRRFLKNKEWRCRNRTPDQSSRQIGLRKQKQQTPSAQHTQWRAPVQKRGSSAGLLQSVDHDRLLHPCRNGNGPDMAAFRKVCIIKLSHSGRPLRSVHRKRSDPFPPPGPARVSQTRMVSAAPRRIVTISASLGLRRGQPRRGRGRACVCVGTGFERLAYKGPHGLCEALERLVQFPSPAQDS